MKPAQEKSEPLVNFSERLESVRAQLGFTWSELGEAIGLGKTQLHYVRKGERGLRRKAERRLESLENTAFYPERTPAPQAVREGAAADDRLRHIEEACADVAAEMKIIRAALAALLAEEERRGARDDAGGKGLKAG